jgi:hypothetical protein
MIGHRQVEQAALFYEFSLERHIPADRVLRSIDRFVELGALERHAAPHRAHRAPEMIKFKRHRASSDIELNARRKSASATALRSPQLLDKPYVTQN